MKHRIVVVALLASFFIEDAYADPAGDLALARKFSPILILTKETSGEYGNVRVTKPEPVEIVGAHSADSLRFRVYEHYHQPDELQSHPTDATVVGFDGWVLTLTYPNVKEFPTASVPGERPTDSDIQSAAPDENFTRIDFPNNQFAFLRLFEYIGAPRGFENGFYKVAPYFDYPGVKPEGKKVPNPFSDGPDSLITPGWNDTYFGSGPHAGENENFPNTSYVHIYKTTHTTYTDSITVIQFFYFYPFNHWWNRHEGDWQRVHVVVNSRDSTTAEIIGVEYLFHKAHLSYYNNFSSKPDITTNYVFNPREEIKLSQGTHPVIYVGAGSHAAYPTGGDFLVYEKASTNERWENMTHTGLILSTQADDFRDDLWERYDLVLLSEPDTTNTTNNMDLPKSMSWLGADVRWGTHRVDSPDSYPVSTPIIGSLANSLVGQQGNDSPPGPYHKGWKKLKFFSPSQTGGDVLGFEGFRRTIRHSDIPYEDYHHWAILGHETWGYRYNPNRDSPGSRSPLPETFRLSRGDTLSLTGDIVIFPNDTLTVVEGSLIEFEPVTDRHQFSVHGADDRRAEIFVYGTLIAEGTFTDSIRFASRDTVFFWDPPAWTGIRVMEGGSVSLSHTRISDTQRPPPGLLA